MRYLSIDIETTGLDPKTNQLIQFAAVSDTLGDKHPVDRLPYFNVLTMSKRYSGHPVALAMHAEKFRQIGDCLKGKPTPGVRFESKYTLAESFGRWLSNIGYNVDTDEQDLIVVAGKNFASFDKLFILKISGMKSFRWCHRVLDPTMLYMDVQIDKEAPPDLEACAERANVTVEGSKHDALRDARLVVHLLRAHYGY